MTAPVQWLLDGTDLVNYARTLLTVDTDLPIVGDDQAVPLVPGETFARRVAGAGNVQLGLLVSGLPSGAGPETVTQWQQNWADLKKLVWQPGKTRTLTRRLLLAAGVVEAAAAATINALPTATMQGERACLTVVDLKLLDGYLYGTTPVAAAAPASITVAGDTRTSRMTITMAAGTLTNTTTGAVLTYTGPGSVVIDVANWTATSSGSPVTGDLSWPVTGHDFWFDLDPGVNVLTGTATISYSPAYLP